MTVPAHALLMAAGGGPPPSIEFVSVGTMATITTETSITPSLPSHAPGDLLMLFIHADQSHNPGTPTGSWTPIFTTGGAGSGSDIAAWYKIAGPSESNPTISVTSNSGGAAAMVVAYRNVDPSTPMDVTWTGNTGANSSTYLGETIVPVTDGAMVVHLYCHRASGTLTYTNQRGFTERARYVNTLPFPSEDRAFHLSDKLVDPAVSTQGPDFTWGTSAYQRYAFALRPA